MLCDGFAVVLREWISISINMKIALILTMENAKQLISLT
jgi:hypothetical protein